MDTGYNEEKVKQLIEETLKPINEKLSSKTISLSEAYVMLSEGLGIPMIVRPWYETIEYYDLKDPVIKFMEEN